MFGGYLPQFLGHLSTIEEIIFKVRYAPCIEAKFIKVSKMVFLKKNIIELDTSEKKKKQWTEKVIEDQNGSPPNN